MDFARLAADDGLGFVDAPRGHETRFHSRTSEKNICENPVYRLAPFGTLRCILDLADEGGLCGAGADQLQYGAAALKGAQQRIEQAEADKLQSARWEILSEGYKMSNYAPLPQMQRTSMYSSMTQQGYAAFFYDMAGNAIPARNGSRWYPAKIRSSTL